MYIPTFVYRPVQRSNPLVDLKMLHIRVIRATCGQASSSLRRVVLVAHSINSTCYCCGPSHAVLAEVSLRKGAVLRLRHVLWNVVQVGGSRLLRHLLLWGPVHGPVLHVWVMLLLHVVVIDRTSGAVPHATAAHGPGPRLLARRN